MTPKKPKRKEREWWVVTTESGCVVERVHTTRYFARLSKKNLDESVPQRAPHRIVLVREILPKRRSR